jgi:hypothetical protein
MRSHDRVAIALAAKATFTHVPISFLASSFKTNLPHRRQVDTERNTRALFGPCLLLRRESGYPSDCFLSLMLASDRRRHPSIGVSCGLISQDGNPTQVIYGSVCIEARGARVFGFTAAAPVFTELDVSARFPSPHHAPVRSPVAANI